MASESSESCDTLEIDGDNLTGNNLGDFGNWYPRRTTRSKQCVFVVRISAMMNKRVRKGNTTRSLDDMRSSKKAVTEPDNNAQQNPSCNDTPVSFSLEIPEPEFFNFDAEKSTEKFQVGQIWENLQ
ncbi:uncharacterized protein Fot_52055 [Forsythia ovata]|uniref:Uncharacterized protein n=1 Tax=Forsythia ovata TaxID=205694 RepID=A0ABD1PKE9_9LAMI